MKKLAKKMIVALLGWQVKRLRAKNQFKVIAVGGSIGKTSTKIAIASVLSQKFRVRYQDGNYNDPVSVPLIFFDQAMPALYNPLSWLKILLTNERILQQPFESDVVVIEVGTDSPGQIKSFGSFISADWAVLTAITPEHMEKFYTLDNVAVEETAIASFAKQLLVNIDWCDAKYLETLKPFLSYGLGSTADFSLSNIQFLDNSYSFEFLKNGSKNLQASHESIAETQLHSVCAGLAVGDIFGLSSDQLLAGIESIKPVAGRMQRLVGVKGSLILDDTYNASPEATKAALNTLYKLKASSKIAILGTMNELGNYSEQAHREVGEHCDPNILDMVVTLGEDASRYLADSAEKKGCKVVRANNPDDAFSKIEPLVNKGTIILAKGSQNGVFAEEVVKKLLANPEDQRQLVRQSPDWLRQKRKQGIIQ